MGHGNVNEAFTVSGVSFVIFAQSPKAVKPAEGPFAHPTFGYNLECMQVIIPLHNL